LRAGSGSKIAPPGSFALLPILTNIGRAPNLRYMDLDELFAKRPDDPLTQLVRQDLDPLSVAELQERVAVLEAELARVNQKIAGSVNFRSTADDLFKK
jgi:uncharacterized small protein (DUF1192 family)